MTPLIHGTTKIPSSLLVSMILGKFGFKPRNALQIQTTALRKLVTELRINYIRRIILSNDSSM
jgi:hypothetical protein